MRRRRCSPALLACAAGLLAVGARAAAPEAPASRVCVAGAEGGPGFECLNAELDAAVEAAAAQRWAVEQAQRGATPGAPPSIGLYNQAAERQRMGSAYGHSIYPQRPARSFPSPLIPPGAQR